MVITKMTTEMGLEMLVHVVPENIVFELFKEIIEIKVEIGGASSFLESVSPAALVIFLTFLWI